LTTAITLISARFAETLSARSDQSEHPVGALAHIAGSEVAWEPTGQPGRRRDIRSWLTFWPDEVSAAAFVERRDAHIPLLGTAVDSIAALLLPYATHGEVTWFGGTPQPMVLSLAPRPGKPDPVFVITSVGLGGLGAGAVAFGQGNYAIRKAIGQQDGLRFEAQLLPDDPTMDGPTLSLWDTEASVIRFAYLDEPHKSAMKVKDHKDLVRASFTRCRVRSVVGSWNGAPIAL
jgi:hypothetical protein